MTDLINGIVLATVLALTLIAFFTVLEALFPAKHQAIRVVAEAQPGRSFLIGSVNFLFFGVIALAALGLAERSGLQVVALVGLLIGALLALALVMGLSASVQLLGRRLAPTGTRVQQSLAGSSMVILAALLPIIGWFVLLPYLILLGLGALIISQRRQRPPQASSSEATNVHSIQAEDFKHG